MVLCTATTNTYSPRAGPAKQRGQTIKLVAQQAAYGTRTYIHNTIVLQHTIPTDSPHLARRHHSRHAATQRPAHDVLGQGSSRAAIWASRAAGWEAGQAQGGAGLQVIYHIVHVLIKVLAVAAEAVAPEVEWQNTLLLSGSDATYRTISARVG